MHRDNLFGLVLIGGKSSRMGRDKSLLQYGEKDQRAVVFDMLKPLCKEVYFSHNKSQEVDQDHSIVDFSKYVETGPMGGLLSAFKRFPGKDFLVVGCDYPYLQRCDLKDFLASVKEDEIASAFYNSDAELYEPLIGFYSSMCAGKLQDMFTEGNYSLQDFLRSVAADKYEPQELKTIFNVNDVEEYLHLKNG